MSPDEHVRDVYAHFGLAIYYSQVLEHGIGNTLVYASLIPSNVGTFHSKTEWEERFDEFLGAHFDKTLGRMISSLKSEVSVPAELESMLAEALKKRNWLAHHYFRDRSNDFMNERGREAMIEELKAAQALFSNADERLEEVTKPLREKYGFTDERLEKFFDEYCTNRKIDI